MAAIAKIYLPRVERLRAPLWPCGPGQCRTKPRAGLSIYRPRLAWGPRLDPNRDPPAAARPPAQPRPPVHLRGAGESRFGWRSGSSGGAVLFFGVFECPCRDTPVATAALIRFTYMPCLSLEGLGLSDEEQEPLQPLDLEPVSVAPCPATPVLSVGQQLQISDLGLLSDSQSSGAPAHEEQERRPRGRPRTRLPLPKRPRGRPRLSPKPQPPPSCDDSSNEPGAPQQDLPLVPFDVAHASAMTLLDKQSRRLPHVTRSVRKFVAYTCGPLPRPAVPSKYEAERVGMQPTSFKQLSTDAGALCQAVGHCFLGAFACALMQEITRRRLRPIACFSSLKYDETPLPFSVRENTTATANEPNPKTVLATRSSQPSVHGKVIGGRLERKDAKILQSDFRIVILCQDVVSSGYVVYDYALPQPLRTLEHCNGRSLASCICEVVRGLCERYLSVCVPL